MRAIIRPREFSRYIVRSGCLAQMSPDELRKHMIPVLRTILLG
ncbi:MAG TPA: hypothetical protein VHZ03_00115 [Trebonia sp.]|nr:hypothetical protein [Trebonia sp.]